MPASGDAAPSRCARAPQTPARSPCGTTRVHRGWSPLRAACGWCLGGVTIADTRHALRVLETSHPPTYYLPPEDVLWEYLEALPGIGSVCEWKGAAHYFSVNSRRTARRCARPGHTLEPTPAF